MSIFRFVRLVQASPVTQKSLRVLITSDKSFILQMAREYNPAMPEWIGKTINRVRIDKYLARGGMAEVYLGTHLTLDRQVAIKVLHSHIEEDSSLLARFQREAKVVAGLRHPNIVQIFDFDTIDGHPFIVMEYLAGSSLAVYLRQLHDAGGRLPYSQVTRLLAALASALDYAHRQGVIHRDVKPGNVLLHAKSEEIQINTDLPEDAEPILTDFGLVRIAHSASQTTSGAVTGTPAYMSPEQASGNPVDSRTDVYSLGIVLYEMLAGRVPFEADSTIAVLLMQIQQPPPPISGIHPAIQKVIDRALEKDPNKRYQTCRELQVDFQLAVENSSRAEAETVAAEEKPTKREQAKGPSRRRVWIIAGVIFFCLCCSLLEIRNRTRSNPTETPSIAESTVETPSLEEPPTEIISLFPPAADGLAVGTLHFADNAGTLSQASISAVLMAPPEGTQYEAWLAGDNGAQSLGVLTLDESGAAQLVFDEPQNQNLLTLFNRFEITLENNPDEDPASSSGTVIYSSALPPESFGYIYPLLVSSDVTPNQVSLIHGMYVQTDLINQSAAAMLGAFESGDEAGMRSNAEAVINLIVGNQGGDFYGDWDGNGESLDPGDGFGLLTNGEQLGYVHGVGAYAEYILNASDANAEIKAYADGVNVCAQNLDAWAVQLRTLSETILQSPYDENIDPTIREAAALASQMISGIDADGNQSTDASLGECGVLTAYAYAYYLPDMYILPGAGQTPLPAQ